MALPVPLTKQELLDPEGVHCDRMRTRLRARLALVAELGCTGQIPPAKAKGYAVGVKAAAELLDRYDPKPRALIEANVSGPLVIQWAGESSSRTSRAPSSNGSTTHLQSNGDARPLSLSTDALESL